MGDGGIRDRDGDRGLVPCPGRVSGRGAGAALGVLGQRAGVLGQSYLLVSQTEGGGSSGVCTRVAGLRT